MRLKELYDLIILKGREADLRGVDGTQTVLDRNKQAFDKLSAAEQKGFDRERLSNPFGDARIVWGNPETEVRRMLAGIDIEADEMLLARRLNRDGWGIDLIFGHHSIGELYHNVEDYNLVDELILIHSGIPPEHAQKIAAQSKEYVRKLVQAHRNGSVPAPRLDTVELARCFNMPVLCIHTPADNFLTRFVYDLIAQEKPGNLNELVQMFADVPEYRRARREDFEIPEIVTGSAESELGKVFVAETNALAICASNCMDELAAAGIRTIIKIPGGQDKMNAEKNNINLVAMPHYASDSLGMNLLFDEVLKQEAIDILCCSGFFREERCL